MADLTVINQPLPPIWMDRMELGVRGDVAVATLRFLALSPPSALLEVARLQTSVVHVQQMVDVLSRVLNYYPTNPEPT